MGYVLKQDPSIEPKYLWKQRLFPAIYQSCLFYAPVLSYPFMAYIFASSLGRFTSPKQIAQELEFRANLIAPGVSSRASPEAWKRWTTKLSTSRRQAAGVKYWIFDADSTFFSAITAWSDAKPESINQRIHSTPSDSELSFRTLLYNTFTSFDAENTALRFVVSIDSTAYVGKH